MKWWIPGVILAVALGPQFSMSSDIPDFPFIFVTGQAETEVPPDIATVTFAIEAFDEDPDKALSVVQERTAELTTGLSSYHIERKDLVAFEITKETVREMKDYVRLRILGYEVSRRISVTVRYLDKYDAFMTRLLSLRNVAKVRTQCDTTKRKVLEVDLLTKAAQKAREQADLLAKSFGREISAVQAISPDSRGFGNLGAEFGMRGGYYGVEGQVFEAALKEKIFLPSTIKLQKAVNAIFRLK